MPAPFSAIAYSAEVCYLEEDDMWLVFIFKKTDWDAKTNENPPVPVDVFASFYEVASLNRAKEVFSDFIIEETAGEIKKI